MTLVDELCTSHQFDKGFHFPRVESFHREVMLIHSREESIFWT